jgi:cell division protein FtsN
VLFINGPISYGQFDSPLNPRQVSINPDLIIQVGAFRQEANSLVLKDKLSAILDKPVILVTEDGFYKVRITGFSNQEEMEKFYPTLAFIGLKNFWVLPVKKQEEIRPQAVIQPDTTRQLISEDTVFPVVSEEIPVASQPVITLQVGVFHDKSEALNAQKMIKTKLNLPVEIVQEWEYYKVFVTGFHTTDEANKYCSALAKLGFPKISLIENYKKK